MNKAEYKKEIYSRLETAQDDMVLEIVLDILQNGLPIKEHILKSESLKLVIDRGLDDIEQGRLLSDEQANSEVDVWLNK